MRQLEQAKQENSTTTAAAAAESSSTSVEMQTTSILNETADRMENGYPVEIPVIGESK